MYVCICNALSDDQIDGTIQSGVRDAHAVHGELGCAVRCGRCIPTIVEMMDAHGSAETDGLPVAAE
jgi:bacterioferritin-associated ferredoxin